MSEIERDQDLARAPKLRAASPSGSAKRGRQGSRRPSGVSLSRFFSQAGVHPFDQVEWELRSAMIASERGETIFEQRDVEIPKAWSQLATNVVVSKYFRGPLGTPQRETSVRQLIGRVVGTIRSWGIAQGYFATPGDAAVFADELTHLLLHQKMGFNSPGWFNVGVEEHPQCSACFLNSVDDSWGSILEVARTEGMLFK